MNFLSLTLSIFVLMAVLPAAFAINIPQFSLPEGAGVIELNDYEQNQKVRKDKDNQGIRRKENVSLKQLVHVAEEKRLTEFDEWVLIYLVDDETTDGGSRGFQQYQRGDRSRLKVRYYFSGEDLVTTTIDGEPLSLTEKQRESIETTARENSFVDKLMRETSGYDWYVGETRDYAPEQAKTLLGATRFSLTLKEVSRRWEKETAEFQLDVAFENGLTCEMFYLVLSEEGRPVNLSSRCHNMKRQGEHTLYYDDVGSRAFSYTDMAISSLSPEPVLAQQPKGKVLDMAFSDATGQLAFLTQDYESTTNWLTFWDLDQRKVVRSQRQAGDRIMFSGDEKTLFSVGNNRIHQGWLKVNNKYQSFGSAVDMNLAEDKQIVDAALFALYPITLNAGGELEVWNLGYNQVLKSIPIRVHQAEKIAINDHGTFVTANREGEFGVHHLSITSACDEPIEAAYCDVIDVDFVEAEKTRTIPLALGKALGRIELHPSENKLVYCSEFPANCGYVDLEQNNHVPFGLARNARFDEKGEVILDTGTFDGESESHFEGFFSYWPNMALSDDRGLIFNKQPRSDHITDHEVVVRDKADGEVIDTVKREVYPVSSLLTFDENNLGFFTSSYGSTRLNVLNIAKLEIEQAEYPFAVYRGDNNQNWMVFSGPDLFLISDVKNEREPIVFNFSVSDFELIDNTLFFSRDSSVYRYDLMENKEVELHTFDSPVHEFLVLDKEKFVVRLNRGVFALPHIDKKLELPFGGAMTDALTRSADGTSFFVSGLTGYSASYNQSIEVIQQFDLDGLPIQEMEPVWGQSQVMLATQDGYLWNGDKSGQLTIRHIDSGLIIDTIQAHQGGIVDIQELNADTIVTGSTDGSVKLWRQDHLNGKFNHNRLGVAHAAFVANDIAKRQLRLKSSVVVNGEGGHIMSSADGYYWASPKALHDASFANGDEIFDYARYDYWLNRPDLLSERLSRPDETALEQWRKMVEFRQGRHPNRSQKIPNNQSEFDFVLSGPEAVVQENTIQVDWSANKQAKRLHVSVNQVPLYGTRGLPLNGEAGSINIDLVPGTNRIKAFVSGAADLPSETRYLTYHGNAEASNELYVLAVGVSDYALERLNLDYAAKDAIDMVRALESSSRFNKVHNKTVLDSEATSAEILAAAEFLKDAKATDTVIVFFAGHGLLDANDDYFFGTTDIDPENPAANGLAYADMSGLLDGLAARQKLMLMDTCFSGEVTEAPTFSELPAGVSTRGLTFATTSEVNISQSMLQKTFVDLRSSTGAIVISAAGGREYALEKENVTNGIFTASFIEGLSKGDTNADGQITVSELRSYTYDEVSRLSFGAQQPTTRKHNLDVDFAIY